MPNQLTMNADVFDFGSPDLEGAAGLQIHFDLNVNLGVLVVDDTIRPSLLAHRRVVGYIRSDGRMYDTEATSAEPFDLEDPGSLGVRLLANDPDLNLDGDVTYRVSGFRYVDGDKVAFGPYETIALPAGDVTVNLADYLLPEVTETLKTSHSLILAAVDRYVEDARAQFRTHARKITSGPNAGLYQYYDESGTPTGDPVELSEIVNVDWDGIPDKPTVIGAGDTAAAARAAINALSPADVAGEVTAAIAAEGSVVTAAADAAEAAVTAEIEGRRILEGRAGESDSFTVVDQHSRAAFSVTSEGNTLLGETVVKTTDSGHYPLNICDTEENVAFAIKPDGTVFVGEFSEDSAAASGVSEEFVEALTADILYSADQGTVFVPPRELRYVDELVDLPAWDHFRRGDVDYGMGIADCGALWHNASQFHLRSGTLQPTGSTRNYAALYCPVRDVRVKCLVSVGATHDFGIGGAVKSDGDDEWSGLEFIWARFRKTGSGTGDQVTILQGTTTLASGSTDFGFTGDTDMVCEFELNGSQASAYVDGELAATATLDSGVLSSIEGRSDIMVSANMTSGEDADTRFAYIEARRARVRTTTAFPHLYAHRATVRYKAENSLQTLPLIPPYVPGIEFDVMSTSDGHLVIMHDTTIDRTTDSTGTVASMTLAQLQQANLTTGGKIPLFSDWLKVCATTHLSELLIDHKGGTLSAIIDMIEASDVADQCILFLHNDADLATARGLSETIRLARASITPASSAAAISAAGAVDAEICFIAPDTIDDGYLSIVADILSAGMVAGISVEQHTDDINAAIEAGATAFICDHAHLQNR